MATITNPEVDSRAYAFVYPILGSKHLPADFPMVVDFDRVVSGIFLPQDQSGRFRKSEFGLMTLLRSSLDVSCWTEDLRWIRQSPVIDGAITLATVVIWTRCCFTCAS